MRDDIIALLRPGFHRDNLEQYLREIEVLRTPSMSEQMLSLHCRTQSGGSKALASLFPLGCARGHYEEEINGVLQLCAKPRA